MADQGPDKYDKEPIGVRLISKPGFPPPHL